MIQIVTRSHLVVDSRLIPGNVTEVMITTHRCHYIFSFMTRCTSLLFSGRRPPASRGDFLPGGKPSLF